MRAQALTRPIDRTALTVDAPLGARRLLDAWHRVECTVAVAAFALMAGILVADVLGREAIVPLAGALGMSAAWASIDGAPKLAVHALVLGTFAGLGLASASGTHLVPRVAFGLVPTRWSSRVDRIADAITAFALICVALAGALLVQSSYRLGLRTAISDWPLWTTQLVLPIGFASAALRHAAFAAWPALAPGRSLDRD